MISFAEYLFAALLVYPFPVFRSPCLASHRCELWVTTFGRESAEMHICQKVFKKSRLELSAGALVKRPPSAIDSPSSSSTFNIFPRRHDGFPPSPMGCGQLRYEVKDLSTAVMWMWMQRPLTREHIPTVIFDSIVFSPLKKQNIAVVSRRC